VLFEHGVFCIWYTEIPINSYLPSVSLATERPLVNCHTVFSPICSISSPTDAPPTLDQGSAKVKIE